MEAAKREQQHLTSRLAEEQHRLALMKQQDLHHDYYQAQVAPNRCQNLQGMMMMQTDPAMKMKMNIMINEAGAAYGV